MAPAGAVDHAAGLQIAGPSRRGDRQGAPAGD
jgi:hypothetical protein